MKNEVKSTCRYCGVLIQTEAGRINGAPGEARHERQIVVDLGRRLGNCLGSDVGERFFPRADTEASFNEHRKTTPGRDLDITGLTYALILRWSRRAMAEDERDACLIRFALAPAANPPVSVAACDIICKGTDASDTPIQAEIDHGTDLTWLQEELKCGTFCGSRLPHIKQILANALRQPPATA